ncbi:MAG: cob(I)yrinic acid a,c-diamide adenosyltransferase [Cyanobacteria bacterium P01_D01_bin.123]
MAVPTRDLHRERMQRRKQIQAERLADMSDRKGLIVVNTGHGKGKSTAGFGVVFRALGHGMPVAVVQFIKGAWEPGEAKLLKSISSDLVEFYAMGEGFTWETQDWDRDRAKAQEAWQKGWELISADRARVVLLDEINVALKHSYLDIDEILHGLKQKPADVHVILTGRGAPQTLIDAADLVTEMSLVKHPFREQGVKAQIGMEY